jgi:Flp pilus assembly CpaE family ATPase
VAAVGRALTRSAQLSVARRCADLAELLSAAAAGLGRVAVVSADLPGLDREGVRHLHGSRAWVVLLVDEAAGWDDERAARLGADVLVPADRPEAVAEAVGGLAGQGERTADRPEPPAPVPPPAPRRDRGRVVAVWGPTGAPGRTTVALGLAEALADDGCLLVDADTYGGTVAPAIGMLDEAPGIAAACRAAATGRLDRVSLGALTPVVAPGLRVLTGISRPERWPEVPAAHLEQVWAAARELDPWTVVDCGFCLERDEALSYDTRAPQRNGATLSALGEADAVVVVGAADPIGLQRLVRGLMDLEDLVPGTRRVVVVTKVRAGVAGTRPADAVRDALARYAGVDDAHLIAWDQAACDAAMLAGRLLGEAGRGSALHRGLADLAGALRAAFAVGAAH